MHPRVFSRYFGYSIACIGALVVFLISAQPTKAEEPCLRGGSGNCVTLTSDSSSTISNPTNLLGGSLANSVVTLGDGTMIAAVAEYSAQTLNPVIRHEIFLYKSIDGGMSWKKMNVQGKSGWYVDEIRGGASAAGSGAAQGAGFLGYSLGVSERSGKVMIYLAHTVACRATATNEETDFGENYPGTNINCALVAPSITAGVVYLATVQYDAVTDQFLQKNHIVISVSKPGIHGNNYSGTTYNCTAAGLNVVCYGFFWGASRPSVGVSSFAANQESVWVSYDSYRGDWCNVGANLCPTYDGAGGGQHGGYSKMLMRRLLIDTSTFLVTSPAPAPLSELASLLKNPYDERFAFYSLTIAAINGNSPYTGYPITFFGYSDRSIPAQAQLDVRYFNNAGNWVSLAGGAKLNNIFDVAGDWQNWDAGWTANPQMNFYASYNVTGGAGAIQTVPTLSASTTKDYFTNHNSPSSKEVVLHLAAYANVSASGSNSTATPVYLRFMLDTATSTWNALPGLVLANPNNAVQPLFNSDKKVFVNAGGPTIGASGKELFIGYPAAPETSFNQRNTNVHYVNVRAIPGATTFTDDNYYWNGVLEYDNEASGAPLAIASVLTPSDGTNDQTTFSPILPRWIDEQGGVDVATSLTNIASPQFVFVRSFDYSATNCGTTTCNVQFAGEPDTYSVRNWGWASTIGWISLSCDNLRTCYKKNSPWSEIADGSYYGVRVVARSDAVNQTAVGYAWSDRIGKISFDRADSVTDTNPCGNPPDTRLQFLRTTGTCAKLDVALDDSLNVTTLSGDYSGFPAGGGYVLIDKEVMRYTNRIGALLNGLDRACSGCDNSRYTSIARDHAIDTPIFYLGATDPTLVSSSVDLFVGISTTDISNYEFDGWARALAWVGYQNTFCPLGIGAGQAPPCDKEWGWIKLDGEWNSAVTTPFIDSVATPSCGTSNAYVESIDGFPEPDAGQSESLYIPFDNCGVLACQWPYNGIDSVGRSFSLDDTLPGGAACTAYNGSAVQWMTTLTSAVTSSDTELPVLSLNGLLPEGAIVISDGINTETVEYATIDESTNTIQNVILTHDYPNPLVTRITQANTSGVYQVFTIPTGARVAEFTLAGFAWSAPNADAPDLSLPRYRDTIAGFGWINFQPNKLDLIYPYLRTLFSDVYIGGDINITGPDPSLDPRQYTSSYLLQTDKDNNITPLTSGGAIASSGAYERCVASCSGDQNCVDTMCAPLEPGYTDLPPVSLAPSDVTAFGRVPSYEDLATWVSDCRDKNGNSVTCRSAVDQARKLSSSDSCIPVGDPNCVFTDTAVDGLNKFGHRVALCRADPNINLSLQVTALDSFTNNAWGSDLCDWQLTTDNYHEVNLDPDGKPLIYILPDEYEDESPFIFSDFPIQVSRAPQGQSGAVTLLVPTSLFFVDINMRYCPESTPGETCPDAASAPSVTNVDQIASFGLITRGSIAMVHFSPIHSFDLKVNTVGAFMILKNEDDTPLIHGITNAFFPNYLLGKMLQYTHYGLIIAPKYYLQGEYYTKESSSGALVEPSENFVYDGRAVLNPPPGFEDVASGLPEIRQAVP